MKGVRFCLEEELTRDVLLELLKSQGAIKEVKGLVEVIVQTMAEASFGVMLEERGGSNSNACSESGDRGGGRRAAIPAGAFHAG